MRIEQGDKTYRDLGYSKSLSRKIAELENVPVFRGDVAGGDLKGQYPRPTVDWEGGYTVYVPSLPGCISQGRTRKEALENIQDAIKGYIESLKKHNDPIPPPIEEEIVEIAV